MLSFDLQQNPPTAEEIAADRQEIERRFAVFKRKAWIGSIALILAVAAVLVAYWPLGDDFVVAITLACVVPGVVFGACAGIVAVAVAVIIASASAGAGARASAGVGVVVGVGVVASLGGNASFGVGVVLGASTVAAVRAFGSRFDGYKEKLSSLDDIDPSACERFLADCLADPLCEDYRRKVAAQDRKLVVAEAKMIRKWAAGADSREQERRAGIACALVASREPLPERY